jgi:hypothetical protein
MLPGTTLLALPAYDPFADATANNGTAYTVGANVYNQTNAQGVPWLQAGPGTGSQITIAADNLTVSGLATSSGHSINVGGEGTSARFAFGGAITSGTVYFSFALRLTDVSAVTTSGIFWAGFNNSLGSQSTTPTTVSTRLITKPSGAGFQIGLDRNSGQASAFVYDPTVYNLGDTVFVVGAYAINSGTANDVAKLWVNPSSVTFGGAEPGGNLSFAGTGADITVNSLVIFDRATTSPVGSTPVGIVDEVRVGTSWADVTPPDVVPEPASAVCIGLGVLGLVAWQYFRKR